MRVWLHETRSNSDSGRLTFLKKTARSPKYLCIATGKWYHNLCHWMDFTQSILWIDAVQAERVYIAVQWKFVWEKIKMSVTFAYIECATWKRYRSIELAESFLLKYRCLAFAKITASALWKKFWTSGIARSSNNLCGLGHFKLYFCFWFYNFPAFCFWFVGACLLTTV